MIAQHGLLGSTYPWKDTNEEGQQVVWSIGDSHTIKTNPTGSSYGPTPAAGTVYQWDVPNQQLYEIGATDILQTGAGANWGSIYPQIGISYFSATGRKPVFVTSGSSGANFAPQGDLNDWSATGSLYGPAKTQLQNCLAYLGLSTPKYILVNCGINDTRSADALATIETEINALFAKLIADFPRATILVTQIGRSEIGERSNTRIHAVRYYLKNVARNNANVHIVAYEGPLYSTGDYDSDNLHLLQTGKNIIGEMHGRWLANHMYSKWARSIIACHFDDLSTTRKGLISTMITALGDGYFNLEFLYNFHTTIENNTFLDWSFLWIGNKVSTTFTANDCITTNGTSNYYHLDFNEARMLTGTALDGSFVGLKIKTNRSAAGGSVRVAIGISNAGGAYAIGQLNTSLTYYRVNDATTTTYATWPSLPNDTFISAGRSGGTKYLYGNGVQVVSAAVAVVAVIDGPMILGGLYANGTPANFIDIDAEYAYGGNISGYAQTVFYDAMEALRDGW
jgi:lysophospholipase L1-like esterase